MNNHIAVNVNGFDDDYKISPLRISQIENTPHYVDLLYFTQNNISLRIDKEL